METVKKKYRIPAEVEMAARAKRARQALGLEKVGVKKPAWLNGEGETQRERVKEWLAGMESGTEVNIQEMAERFGMKFERARTELYHLWVLGVVSRPGRGRYATP
jgi:hypothetical protein